MLCGSFEIYSYVRGTRHQSMIEALRYGDSYSADISENTLSPHPLLFVLGFAGGWLLDRSDSFSLLPVQWRGMSLLCGWLLVGTGLAVMLSGLISFFRARTAVMPNRSASVLVIRGPYRFTRNPMYVGLSMAYVGGILLTNNTWCLLFLPAVLFLIHVFVIRREERYLKDAFGESYLNYCARVRRWL